MEKTKHEHEHEHVQSCGCGCGCHDEHEHSHGDENHTLKIARLAVGTIILIVCIIAENFGFFGLAEKTVSLGAKIALSVAYIILGYDVVISAIRSLFSKHALAETFLMTIATVGAIAIGDFPEACAVMLFYQIGELLEDIAVGRSRDSISKLMDIRPDRALVRRGDTWTDVSPDEIAVGETILVKPGEKVPLDGIVSSGSSSLDTRALTGESLPCDISVGDAILSGSVNLTSPLEITVAKEFGESTASKIIDLVENAGAVKSRSESVISRFAKIYTPAVVALSAAVALIPSLITGDWVTWVNRGLVTLVTSCPCALVVSVPLTYFAGLGTASRLGLLIKGSTYLEALADVSCVALDKTGTLTKGVFSVSAIRAENTSDDTVLQHAAYAEHFSSHPIARSITREFESLGCAVNEAEIADYSEFAGRGVKVDHVTDGVILAGRADFLAECGISVPKTNAVGTVVYVAANGEYEGYIVISDEIKHESAELVRELNNSGAEVVMLTGDSEAAAAAVAKTLGIKKYKSALLPDGKVGAIEELLDGKRTRGGKLVFVGDGINDAPSLARADVGIGMGGIGSDAAIEAADAVLMTDDLSVICKIIRLARRVKSIIRENITFALAVKIVLILLGWIGISSMWWAVFGDVGVLLIVIANSMRVSRA